MIVDLFKACFYGPVIYRIFSVFLLIAIGFWLYCGIKIVEHKVTNAENNIQADVAEPELDISISGSNLKLTNEGKIDIIDVKLIDIVGIHFNIATKKIGTHHVESPHRVMFPKIKPGLPAKYPIKNMAIQLGKKASPNEFEAYCFFIRFRRPSDRKSYVRPVKVVRVVEKEKEMFFPLEPMKGAIMASSSNEMFFDILREKLDKICRDRFGQYL